MFSKESTIDITIESYSIVNGGVVCRKDQKLFLTKVIWLLFTPISEKQIQSSEHSDGYRRESFLLPLTKIFVHFLVQSDFSKNQSSGGLR